MLFRSNRFIDIGFGRGTELNCLYHNMNKKCTKKCKEACKQECAATPECDEPGETCAAPDVQNSNCIAGTTGDDGGDLGPFPTKKAKFCAAAGAAALCPISCGTCKESCVDGSTLPACVTGVSQNKAVFCVFNTLETCAVSCGSCPV